MDEAPETFMYTLKDLREELAVYISNPDAKPRIFPANAYQVVRKYRDQGKLTEAIQYMLRECGNILVSVWKSALESAQITEEEKVKKIIRILSIWKRVITLQESEEIQKNVKALALPNTGNNVELEIPSITDLRDFTQNAQPQHIKAGTEIAKMASNLAGKVKERIDAAGNTLISQGGRNVTYDNVIVSMFAWLNSQGNLSQKESAETDWNVKKDIVLRKITEQVLAELQLDFASGIQDKLAEYAVKILKDTINNNGVIPETEAFALVHEASRDVLAVDQMKQFFNENGLELVSLASRNATLTPFSQELFGKGNPMVQELIKVNAENSSNLMATTQKFGNMVNEFVILSKQANENLFLANQNLASAQGNLNKVLSENKEKDEENRRLWNERGEMQEKIGGFESEVKALQKENKRLRSEKDELQKRYDELQRKYEELQRKYDESQKGKEEAEKKALKRKGEKKEAKQEAERYKARIEMTNMYGGYRTEPLASTRFRREEVVEDETYMPQQRSGYNTDRPLDPPTRPKRVIDVPVIAGLPEKKDYKYTLDELKNMAVYEGSKKEKYDRLLAIMIDRVNDVHAWEQLKNLLFKVSLNEIVKDVLDFLYDHYNEYYGKYYTKH